MVKPFFIICPFESTEIVYNINSLENTEQVLESDFEFGFIFAEETGLRHLFANFFQTVDIVGNFNSLKQTNDEKRVCYLYLRVLLLLCCVRYHWASSPYRVTRLRMRACLTNSEK
jgi:hypothetical protein